MRVLGVRTGVPVLLIDMLKGWAAVSLMKLQPEAASGGEPFMMISIALGILAVMGHIFPILAGFRGGKGVATISGVCFALHPAATAAALGIFILVLVLSQYVSLASMTAGITFPVWVILVFQSPYISLWIFALAATFLLLITHRKNIKRLRSGQENRASFLFRNAH
jgi:glycerol-3-phosphate acyltransferase PlsY